MRARSIFRPALPILLAIFLLASGFGLQVRPQAGLAASEPPITQWFLDTLELSKKNAAPSASIAFDPRNNTPYIAYYDPNYGDLRLASQVLTGGNCGPRNAWNCWSADAEGDVGRYASIDFFVSADIWRLGIAYHDSDNASLEYAEYTCNAFNCVWTFTHIAETNTISQGLYNSLKFDKDGVPHIAYYAKALDTNDALMYASFVGSGGNCYPNGTWQCDAIETGEKMGLRPALQFNASGMPRIAYYDEKNGFVKYAKYTGTQLDNCGAANGWKCSPVDAGTGASLGLNIAEESSETPQIAYYSPLGTGKLKIARYVTSQGNCGLNGEWLCQEIDDMGVAPDLELSLSMTADADGNPFIAYQQAPGGARPAGLKIARPVAAIGYAAGNCGPKVTIPTVHFTWQCDMLDSGYSGVNHEGFYAAMGLRENGLGLVAYFETDAYRGGGNLKIAYQKFLGYLPVLKR